MKDALLQKFEDSLAADNAAQILSAAGIDFRLKTHAPEYTSIVLGGPLKNRVDIFVNEIDLEKASLALKANIPFNASTSELTSDDTDRNKPEEHNHFKRAVILSFLGIFVLPIIFNCLATVNLWKLFRGPESFLKKAFALTVVVLGWLAAATLIEAIVVALQS